MKAAQEFIRQFEEARTFRMLRFESKSKPGQVWEARIFYGGSQNSPLISCTCPAGRFRQECAHMQKLLDSITGGDWMFIIHHDEMRRKWGRNPSL